MLSKYEEFILERQENEILNLITEAFFLISPKLSDVFNDMADSNKSYSKIAKAITSMDVSDIDTNVSYLDLTDDNSMISFLDPEKVDKYIEENDITRSQVYGKLNGNKLKVGRLVRKLLDIYNKDKKDSSIFTYKDSDIEDFVNAFKANYDFTIKKTGRLELVSGDKIKYVYDSNNYRDDNGNLGSSCMRYEDCQDYLTIYTDNKTVEVLALFDPNDKIMGRSIIWTLSDGNKFMDRIYTSADSDVNHFIKYAEENKMLYKKVQNSKQGESIFGINGDYEVYEYLKMEVDVNKPDGERVSDSFPYMDTMKYYYWKIGKLKNWKDTFEYYVFLEDTDGCVECDNCYSEGSISCEVCDGDGHIDCGVCNGEGNTHCESCDGDGHIDCDCENKDECDKCGGSFYIDCDECNGNGYIGCKDCNENGNKTCQECDGDGSSKCNQCGGYSNRDY